MLPLFMLMQAAGQDPQTWGPILDSLGFQFRPDNVVPGLTRMANGPQDIFSSSTPLASPTIGAGAGDMPLTYQPTVPPAPTTPPTVPPITPPPNSGVGIGSPVPMGPAPGTDPMSALMSILGMGSTTTPAPTVTPPPVTPPPSSGRGPPVVGPQAIRPTSPTPVFGGGITGAQKAPDIGAAMTTGGTPAQLLMQALLNAGRGQTNPLRVPSLGELLKGGV